MQKVQVRLKFFGFPNMKTCFETYLKYNLIFCFSSLGPDHHSYQVSTVSNYQSFYFLKAHSNSSPLLVKPSSSPLSLNSKKQSKAEPLPPPQLSSKLQNQSNNSHSCLFAQLKSFFGTAMEEEPQTQWGLQCSQYLGEISALCFLHFPIHLSSLPYLLAGTLSSPPLHSHSLTQFFI